MTNTGLYIYKPGEIKSVEEVATTISGIKELEQLEEANLIPLFKEAVENRDRNFLESNLGKDVAILVVVVALTIIFTALAIAFPPIALGVVAGICLFASLIASIGVVGNLTRRYKYGTQVDEAAKKLVDAEIEVQGRTGGFQMERRRKKVTILQPTEIVLSQTTIDADSLPQPERRPVDIE